MQGVLPYPDGQWDYEWCCENWGTEWDMRVEDFEYEPDNDCIYIRFITAWAPPEPYFIAASKKYPLLEFQYTVEEESTAYLPYEATLLNERVTQHVLDENELRNLFENQLEWMSSDEEDDSDEEPAAQLSEISELDVLTLQMSSKRTSLVIFSKTCVNRGFTLIKYFCENKAGDFLRAGYVDSACEAIAECPDGIDYFLWDTDDVDKIDLNDQFIVHTNSKRYSFFNRPYDVRKPKRILSWKKTWANINLWPKQSKFTQVTNPEK
eukprot:SAG11_NODE_4923_length_1721_cov_6.439581_1_plen_265_part_00